GKVWGAIQWNASEVLTAWRCGLSVGEGPVTRNSQSSGTSDKKQLLPPCSWPIHWRIQRLLCSPVTVRWRATFQNFVRKTRRYLLLPRATKYIANCQFTGAFIQ